MPVGSNDASPVHPQVGADGAPGETGAKGEAWEISSKFMEFDWEYMNSKPMHSYYELNYGRQPIPGTPGGNAGQGGLGGRGGVQGSVVVMDPKKGTKVETLGKSGMTYHGATCGEPGAGGKTHPQVLDYCAISHSHHIFKARRVESESAAYGEPNSGGGSSKDHPGKHQKGRYGSLYGSNNKIISSYYKYPYPLVSKDDRRFKESVQHGKGKTVAKRTHLDTSADSKAGIDTEGVCLRAAKALTVAGMNEAQAAFAQCFAQLMNSDRIFTFDEGSAHLAKQDTAAYLKALAAVAKGGEAANLDLHAEEEQERQGEVEILIDFAGSDSEVEKAALGASQRVKLIKGDANLSATYNAAAHAYNRSGCPGDLHAVVREFSKLDLASPKLCLMKLSRSTFLTCMLAEVLYCGIGKGSLAMDRGAEARTIFGALQRVTAAGKSNFLGVNTANLKDLQLAYSLEAFKVSAVRTRLAGALSPGAAELQHGDYVAFRQGRLVRRLEPLPTLGDRQEHGALQAAVEAFNTPWASPEEPPKECAAALLEAVATAFYNDAVAGAKPVLFEGCGAAALCGWFSLFVNVFCQNALVLNLYAWPVEERTGDSPPPALWWNLKNDVPSTITVPRTRSVCDPIFLAMLGSLSIDRVTMSYAAAEFTPDADDVLLLLEALHIKPSLEVANEVLRAFVKYCASTEPRGEDDSKPALIPLPSHYAGLTNALYAAFAPPPDSVGFEVTACTAPGMWHYSGDRHIHVSEGSGAFLMTTSLCGEPGYFSFTPVSDGDKEADWLRRDDAGRICACSYEDGDAFKNEASFKVVHGLNGEAGAVSFECKDKPGWYLRHRDGALCAEAQDGDRFAGDASFTMSGAGRKQRDSAVDVGLLLSVGKCNAPKAAHGIRQIAMFFAATARIEDLAPQAAEDGSVATFAAVVNDYVSRCVGILESDDGRPAQLTLISEEDARKWEAVRATEVQDLAQQFKANVEGFQAPSSPTAEEAARLAEVTGRYETVVDTAAAMRCNAPRPHASKRSA